MTRRDVSIAAAVVAGLLVAVFWPIYTGYDQPRRNESLSRLHQLWVALNIYVADQGAFPPMADAHAMKKALFPDYITDQTLFLNPNTGLSFIPNRRLTGKETALLMKDIEHTVVLYSFDPHGDGKWDVIFLDGSARRIDSPEWARIQEESRTP